jgi:hypothetical protein
MLDLLWGVFLVAATLCCIALSIQWRDQSPYADQEEVPGA